MSQRLVKAGAILISVDAFAPVLIGHEYGEREAAEIPARATAFPAMWSGRGAAAHVAHLGFAFGHVPRQSPVATLKWRTRCR